MTSKIRSPSGLGILKFYIVFLLLCRMQDYIDAAPLQESIDLQQYSEGCYYNFNYYNEGDRISTNEPCLNCTCHNKMLMCYLRVCPFTKPIGQDCVIEKREDLCCPIVTCPEVPVKLSHSSDTITEIALPEKNGCIVDNKFYSQGSQVPSSPDKPCELCYCIQNKTSCLIQECTLHIDGCQAIYNKDSCCPERYNCSHEEEFLEDGSITTTTATTTTFKFTQGSLLTTTRSPLNTECYLNGITYADGLLIETKDSCESCYCMHGDIVCAVQKCEVPFMEVDGEICKAGVKMEGECCPSNYICESIGSLNPESMHIISQEDVKLQQHIDKENIYNTEKEKDDAKEKQDSISIEKTTVAISVTETTVKSTENYVNNLGIPTNEPQENETKTEHNLILSTDYPEINKDSGLDVGYIPISIPGEGNCLVNGQTYSNNSEVATSNKCEEYCSCVSSVVKCKMVECESEPYNKNCIVDNNTSDCCPLYICNFDFPSKDESTTPDTKSKENLLENEKNEVTIETSTPFSMPVENEKPTEEEIMYSVDDSPTKSILQKPQQIDKKQSLDIDNFDLTTSNNFIMNHEEQDTSLMTSTTKEKNEPITSKPPFEKEVTVTEGENEHTDYKKNEFQFSTEISYIETLEHSSIKNSSDELKEHTISTTTEAIFPDIYSETSEQNNTFKKGSADVISQVTDIGLSSDEKDAEEYLSSTQAPSTEAENIDNIFLLNEKDDFESMQPPSDNLFIEENNYDLNTTSSNVDNLHYNYKNKFQDVKDEETIITTPISDVERIDTNELTKVAKLEADLIEESSTSFYIEEESNENAGITTKNLLSIIKATEPVYASSQENTSQNRKESNAVTVENNMYELNNSAESFKNKSKLSYKIITTDPSITEAPTSLHPVTKDEQENFSEQFNNADENNIDIEEKLSKNKNEDNFTNTTNQSAMQNKDEYFITEPETTNNSQNNESDSIKFSEDMFDMPIEIPDSTENIEENLISTTENSNIDDQTSKSKHNIEEYLQNISLGFDLDTSSISSKGDILFTSSSNEKDDIVSDNITNTEIINEIITTEKSITEVTGIDELDTYKYVTELYYDEKNHSSTTDNNNQEEALVLNTSNSANIEDQTTVNSTNNSYNSNKTQGLKKEGLKAESNNIESSSVVNESDDLTTEHSEDFQNIAIEENKIFVTESFSTDEFTPHYIEDNSTSISEDHNTEFVTELEVDNELLESFGIKENTSNLETPSEVYEHTTNTNSISLIPLKQKEHKLEEYFDTYLGYTTEQQIDINNKGKRNESEENNYIGDTMESTTVSKNQLINHQKNILEDNSVANSEYTTEHTIETDSQSINYEENKLEEMHMENLTFFEKNIYQEEHKIKDFELSEFATEQSFVTVPEESKLIIKEDILDEGNDVDLEFSTKYPKDAAVDEMQLNNQFTENPPVDSEYATDNSIHSNSQETTIHIEEKYLFNQQEMNEVNNSISSSLNNQEIHIKDIVSTPSVVSSEVYTTEFPSSEKDFILSSPQYEKEHNEIEPNINLNSETNYQGILSDDKTFHIVDMTEIPETITKSNGKNESELDINQLDENGLNKKINNSEILNRIEELQTTTLMKINDSTTVKSIAQQALEKENIDKFEMITENSKENFTTSFPHIIQNLTEQSPTALSPQSTYSTIAEQTGYAPPQYSTGYDEEYIEEDDSDIFAPGTCRYGGKLYVSAQQIPRDDPCDFCFCFRSDIICLQQSCPPPISGCREEPIHGFCCPRYECPVSMNTMFNFTSSTSTTSTSLPPQFFSKNYNGMTKKSGCFINGQTYKVGEEISSSSGPCMQCLCGGDGQMQCSPVACSPEPLMRQMVAHAISSKR